LINLLTNAIKFSPHADKVIINIAQTKDELIVSVQDFGIGIAKEHQEKIFERFYRIYSGKGKNYPGLGIGLYLSHEIIRRHGGKLWVESIEGKGSVFSFALPVVAAEEA
jgi:signal transduction histidine kinase